jgi:hypothetical protein
MIEKRVKKLIEVLNSIPDVRVASSCGGHKKPDTEHVEHGAFYVNFVVNPTDDAWDALESISRAIDVHKAKNKRGNIIGFSIYNRNAVVVFELAWFDMDGQSGGISDEEIDDFVSILSGILELDKSSYRDCYCHMDRLDQSMNFRVNRGYPIDGRTDVFIEDHRAVIPAIWAAFKDGIFTSPPVLIRFDKHNDACPDHYYDSLGSFGMNDITDVDECLSFANKLAPLDDSWVYVAAKMGMVKGVITFFADCPAEGNYPQKERHGSVPHYYLGLFENFHSDLSEDERLEEIRELLNLDQNAIKDHGLLQNWDVPVWFDIDLDFAVHDIDGFDPRIWDKEDFSRQFQKNDFSLLNFLLRQSKLLTIATEPNYTQSYVNSARIFNELKELGLDLGDF